MATADPFAVLGLKPTATKDEIVGARRRLAKLNHPDSGGTTERMVAINAAAAAALEVVAKGRSGSQRRPTTRHTNAAARRERRYGSHITTDQPSFVIEALPAVAFEALLVAVSGLGDVTDSDPPYRMVADLADPIRCFCQLELMPEAAASMVSLAVAPAPGSPRVPIEVVRDAIIAELNGLDWSEFP